MITPAYAQTMARYNAWQNNQLRPVVETMDQADLNLDRGAFFGSLQRTLNHLLWGDQLWLSRFDGQSAPPQLENTDSTDLWDTISEWSAERAQCDTALLAWADGLGGNDLNGVLSWRSAATNKEFDQSLALCVVQFFNHQTHHRGQVHAMLTAAGQKAPVSDVIYMPEMT